ncbi:carboxypeptidase-like regulatory domain-containing protein [Pontibacter anaerobius]|uniref:Carboxypeptidase-like regulatory domain-containing protein n=1 Tax=Pontibacter anaerobius TaxID=2993940 RepID=A0ABT3RC05_9BACT|nr:carboxypeptidase-like regulatory domain-containing protein [Pontibacter anaerobius]MCX2738892.1 carboxypeptidase-like regulatory domain-containing protein [Pontibacter anaerobius]
MSKHIFTLLLALLAFGAEAQSIKLQGRVLEQVSGKGLPYVNIGIRNKNLGTASDEQGKFILSFPQSLQHDTITFSAVGYEEVSVPVQELSQRQPLEVKLLEKVNMLQEVVVQSRNLKTRKLGVTGRLPVVWGNPEHHEGKDVYEFANFIAVKGRATELLSAHFYLTSQKLDSALFRINLYKNNNGLPGERLVEKSIVQRLTTKDGWISINLQPYGIYTGDDFFLGIEYLPGDGVDKYAISLGGKLGGSSYSRKSSLGAWEKFVGASLSGYVTVRQ